MKRKPAKNSKDARPFSLANADHLCNFMALMMATGAACHKCGFGTRATSKNWTRCKREGCGYRMRRLSTEEAANALSAGEFEIV